MIRPEGSRPVYFAHFDVDSPGDLAGGLRPYRDRVRGEFESGDPGGEPGEVAEYMREAIQGWYEDAIVETQAHTWKLFSLESYPAEPPGVFRGMLFALLFALAMVAGTIAVFLIF